MGKANGTRRIVLPDGPMCLSLKKGLSEAVSAGRLLKAEGFVFDKAFTSVLKRAIKTLWCVLEEMDLMWIPVELSWKLNERHYGALQGLNKAETAAQYGNEQGKNLAAQLRHPPSPFLIKTTSAIPEAIHAMRDFLKMKSQRENVLPIQ